MTQNNFPDQFAVEFIRNSLWRLTGNRAAVMVGAGFSRNAHPTSASAKSMPSWSQMAHALCDTLYASHSERRDAALREASSTSGFLRLAQEYEAAFGQLALNEQIRALVPDMEYDPSQLHKQLLSLPWTDVHTTNWDTLLERTAREVFHIDYDVVRTQSEIPSSRRPRIIKLHGTFPANEPFVFTEDDYRKYPVTHAPFVNLVQQSLMESVLCLIGFSGDDPNFLHWTGWVRDNLGKNSPKIYLVGWLDLSPQRRRLLEDRNVIPVDLSKLPIASTWPQEQRYRYATEWFIHAIGVRERFNPKKWPNVAIPVVVTPTYLGTLPFPTETLPKKEPLAPDPNQRSQENLVDELTAINAVWKWNRLLYPGWFVAPSAVRRQIWMYTFSWFATILNSQEYLHPVQFLRILDELIWRLNVCLAPYFSDVVVAAERALAQIDLDSKKIHLQDENLSVVEIDWAELVAPWCRIVLMLVRDARTSAQFEKATRLLVSLRSLAVHDDELHHAYHYEQCLLHRDKAEFTELEKYLHSWDVANTDTAWSIRKAGLLAQIGQVEAVKKCFRAALTETRRHRRKDKIDYAAFSREGWLLWYEAAFLLRGETVNESLDAGPQPHDRWNELSVYNCNAQDDYDQLVTQLHRSIAAKKPEISEATDFYGIRRQTVHLNNGFQDYLRHSYEIFQLADTVGLPASMVSVSILGDGLRSAIHALTEADPWLCAIWTIKSASTSSDEHLEFFSRVRIALLPEQQVNFLVSYTESEINFALNCAQGSYVSHWSNRLKIAVEVLARLNHRCRSEDAEDFFKRTLLLLNHPRCTKNITLQSNLKNLLKSALKAIPKKLLVEMMPEVFALSHLTSSFHFLDPAELWPRDIVIKIQDVNKRDYRWTDIIRQLLVNAKCDDLQVKRRALQGLTIIVQAGLLKEDESANLATALWNSIALDTSGWPLAYNLWPWAMFSLPEMTPGQREIAFLNKYLSVVVENGSERQLWIIGNTLNSARMNGLPIKLNEKNIAIIRQVISTWSEIPIQSPKTGIEQLLGANEQGSSDADAVSGLFHLLPEIDISREIAEKIWEKVETAGSTLTGIGIQLYPILLPYFPECFEQVVTKIREGLVSDNQQECWGACNALCRWFDICIRNQTVSLPANDLIVEIGNAIARRRPAILIQALEFATWLILQGPLEFRPLILKEIETGLSFMLEETKYDVGPAKFDGLDLPKLRARITSLARAIIISYHSAPPIFQQWIEIAQVDPLAEVRNAISNEGSDENPIVINT